MENVTIQFVDTICINIKEIRNYNNITLYLPTAYYYIVGTWVAKYKQTRRRWGKAFVILFRVLI